MDLSGFITVRNSVSMKDSCVVHTDFNQGGLNWLESNRYLVTLMTSSDIGNWKPTKHSWWDPMLPVDFTGIYSCSVV